MMSTPSWKKLNDSYERGFFIDCRLNECTASDFTAIVTLCKLMFGVHRRSKANAEPITANLASRLS